MGSLTQTQHNLYLSGHTSSSWAQDAPSSSTHQWSEPMYHRNDPQYGATCSDYNVLGSLQVYPSDYSVASDSPDPECPPPGICIQSSSLRLDTRSYTLSDALRPRHSDWTASSPPPQNRGNQSHQLSPESEFYQFHHTRSPSIDRSLTTTPSNADLEEVSEGIGARQRVILVKEENEDPLEGLFVLESQSLPASEVVETAPNLRFRRQKTPTTEAMRKRMTVFHVNPFASSRVSASASAASPNSKQQPLDPAFLTFQLVNDTLEPVDDPEIQFFVTFVDECEYDDEDDDGDDPGRYSWPHSVVIKRPNDVSSMKQLVHVANPFSEFTGLTVSGSPGDKSHDRDTPSHPSRSKLSSSFRSNQASLASKKKPKLHECNICHKAFPRPSGLSTHMNSHSGDKRQSASFSVAYET
ncbi:hypothetical protein OE88DRAFT_1646688 [Heliocybe sulcata]|uniref:C2H2-type domain-containing protein n=1 Tax=Heliocybe sulcata TaxID=5364 RepID=A0A5C3MUF6_9AGAM|nr:hypothetical protein OE88DRAFT_1646688 [Heliocybe sulcata]